MAPTDRPSSADTPTILSTVALPQGSLRNSRGSIRLTDGGFRRNKHHQWFTSDFGHPKLREHLAGVIALMRVAPSWDWFTRNIARAYPKVNEQIPLPFDVE